MLLSRFWYVLLGLLLGTMVFLLHVASSMYNRAGLRFRSEGLSADVQVVSWYLRDDARQRSAQLIQFALDPDVSKYLQQASGSDSKLSNDTRERLLGALKRVSTQVPKDLAFDAVFAVDQHGRVVAYLGYEQGAGGEDFELGGYPVVADALHGYVRDDTLILDRPYRVVARPVEYDMSTMPAGAIVGARAIDDRFAQELVERTGAAVAFYAPTLTNRVRAGAAAPPDSPFDVARFDQIIGDLADLEEDKDYKEKGRSSVREIGGQLSVQYSRLPGEAWRLGAGYAVARLPATVSGPLGFFGVADDKDKAAGNIGLAILLALGGAGLGIFFSILEHTRPLRIFKREVQKLGAGEIDALAPSKFRGLYRKIASDLNDGVDKILAKGGGPRRGPADFKEVLGDIPDQPQMSAFSLPGDAVASEAASAGSHPASVPPSAASRPLPPSAPKRMPRPPSAPGASPTANLDATMPEGGLGGWGSGASDEHEWRQVFQEFVNTKRQCGENVDGFTYEKFEVTLRKNRDTLIQRHGAARVKFSVYVKDGKAALKANPIRE